jgi:transposase-like protein
MGDKRMFTDEEQVQIASEYLDSWITMQELADKWGASQSTISRIVSRSEVLDKAEARASASARRAKIRAQLHSDEIMRMQIEDAKNTREDKFGHLHQNARRDILDRAGVRQTATEDNSVNIKIDTGGSGIKLGMPRSGAEE